MSSPYRAEQTEAKPKSYDKLLFLLVGILFAGIFALTRWGCAGRAKGVAEAFLEHVNERDYAGAYELTSASFRATVPADGLSDYLATNVPGLDHTTAANAGQVFGAPSALCCDAYLTDELFRSREDLARDEFFLVLVEEEQGYRVASVTRARPPQCEDTD
jgi:hypothetical protein